MDSHLSKKKKSDAVRWNENGPAAPLIVPIIFFLVIGLALGLIVLKVLRKYWDRKRKSDSYIFVDNGEDKIAVLKKAKEEEEEADEGLKLNSIAVLNEMKNQIKNDKGNEREDVKDTINTWDDDNHALSKFENEDESVISHTETLPLNKKRFKATESDV